MKVLVLDDDRAFLDMVRRALGEAGHQVAEAVDGRVGLAVAESWDPDVVLLDVRMPRLDGPTFAARYRALPGRHAPIIVLSGFDDARTRVRHAAAYLRKPFELEDLLGLISKVGPGKAA